MIEIQKLSCSYGERQVLQNISLTVKDGELLSVLGANGAGKSTLLKCILGLIPYRAGTILADGIDIRALSVRELAEKIAYIPQESSSAFNYSVYDIVMMGTTPWLGALKGPGKKEALRVNGALKKAGILYLKNRCFHRLSGGEKQLVLLARAIAQNAGILLLDEPSSALDLGNRTMVLELLRNLANEGYTVVQTTHDAETAFIYSDLVAVLKGGCLYRLGSPKQVLTKKTIEDIYGLEVTENELLNGRARVFIPSSDSCL